MPHSLLITLEYPSFSAHEADSAGTATHYGGVANYYHGIAVNWTQGKLEVLHVKLGRMWPRWLSILGTVWKRVNSLTREHANRIHLLQVGQVLPLGYVALLLKWLYGIPYLVYIHGMDVLVPQAKTHKKWLLKFILQQAKIVVANSDFTKGEVVRLGIAASKVVVVYPSLEAKKEFEREVSPKNKTAEAEWARGPAVGGTSEAEPLRPAATPGLPSLVVRGDASRDNSFLREPTILTVARLVKRKGIDTVLAALPEVIKKVPHVQYVVIGTGPELSAYKLQVPTLWSGSRHEVVGTTNYKLGYHVTFLGEVSDEERTSWYQRASVFVLTPRQIEGDVEGFGLVYLEANSFGLPVVGSRTGGVPEAVQNGVNGLLVEPNNPQQTAQALIELLTKKSLADTLGVQGKERVNKEFTWDIQLQKLFNALSQ